MSFFDTPQPLHPESRAFLEAVSKMNLRPYNELATVEEARTRSERASRLGDGDFQFDGVVEDIVVPQQQVAEGIPVSVYRPSNVVAHPPIVVYFHGGGNVVGSRKTVDCLCKILSNGAGCIVVSVEYRLAPEHKFPAGIDDSCGVTKWVTENRVKLGGSEKSKVGVAGDSAGGQNAASVAHDVPGLSFQILVYPHVSARGDRSLKSFQEYDKGPVLPRDLIDWFENLMGDKKDWKNPRFANLLREKFDHLPPALLVVAECDPLRDDSYEYAKKLTAAGVHNELYLAIGAVHAFFTLPGIFPELCKAAHGKCIEFIKQFGYSA